MGSFQESDLFFERDDTAVEILQLHLNQGMLGSLLKKYAREYWKHNEDEDDDYEEE